MVEPVNKLFLKRRYGSDDDGNLYKCLGSLQPISDIDNLGVRDWRNNYFPNYELKTNEEEEDHLVLHTFLDSINTLEGDMFQSYIERKFDIDIFLRYMAANILIGNDDDYTFAGNNYFLYFGEDDGKIRFIPHDLDKGLGRQADQDLNFTTQPLYSYPENYILSYKILAVQKFKDQYLNYIKVLLQKKYKLFSFDDYSNRFAYLYRLYAPYLDNFMDEGEFMDSEESFSYIKARIDYVVGIVYGISDKNRGL
jgi:hypothetical protein